MNKHKKSTIKLLIYAVIKKKIITINKQYKKKEEIENYIKYDMFKVLSFSSILKIL